MSIYKCTQKERHIYNMNSNKILTGDDDHENICNFQNNTNVPIIFVASFTEYICLDRQLYDVLEIEFLADWKIFALKRNP